jgi:hypothetical protein
MRIKTIIAVAAFGSAIATAHAAEEHPRCEKLAGDYKCVGRCLGEYKKLLIHYAAWERYFFIFTDSKGVEVAQGGRLVGDSYQFGNGLEAGVATPNKDCSGVSTKHQNYTQEWVLVKDP